MVFVGKLVEAHKELVKCPDQIVGADLVRKFREAHNISVNDRHIVVTLNVDFVELFFGLFFG